MVKNLPVMWETWVRFLGWEDPLEEEMDTHSSILAWRIPMGKGTWQATVQGVARVRYYLATKPPPPKSCLKKKKIIQSLIFPFCKIHWNTLPPWVSLGGQPRPRVCSLNIWIFLSITRYLFWCLFLFFKYTWACVSTRGAGKAQKLFGPGFTVY